MHLLLDEYLDQYRPQYNLSLAMENQLPLCVNKKVLLISGLLALQSVFAASKDRTIIDSFTSSGIPVISIVTLFLAIVFFFVRGHFGISFRANKKSVLIALLMIALFAWPFKYFKKNTVDSNSLPIKIQLEDLK